jgi:dsDNA-specific endonuclease/ATPase MutS2
MSDSKVCTRCNKTQKLSLFSKDKTRVDGLYKWCRLCVSEYQREYRGKNKEKIKQKSAKYYQENKEKIYQKYLERYLVKKDEILKRNADWVSKNKERVKKYVSNYAKEKKHEYAARCLKRYTEQKKRLPLWVNKETLDEIEKIYEAARLKTEITGIKHHVDHIIPLQGKFVSGFHVPQNLQILTCTENSRKSNKYDEWGSDA